MISRELPLTALPTGKVIAALKCVSAALDVEPAATLLRRPRDRAMMCRKLWLYALKEHITVDALAKISGISRRTIDRDQADVAAWRERNQFLYDLTDRVVESTSIFLSLRADADDLVTEMLLEQENDWKDQPRKPSSHYREASQVLLRLVHTSTDDRWTEARLIRAIG